MNTRMTIISVITSIHFLVSLAQAASVEFAGKLPPEALAVMLYPIAWLTFADPLWDNWFTMSLLFYVNSVIWGVCIGLIIHAIKQRFHRRAA